MLALLLPVALLVACSPHPSLCLSPRLAHPFALLGAQAGLDIEGGKKGPEAFHEGEEVAGMSYRRTLERALPGFWKVLGNLFRPIDMYEPAFKEMVVVFRRTEEEVRHC